MAAATVSVGEARVTYLHDDPASLYALLDWESPVGAAGPPVHIHHRTEEGFYVTEGRFKFLVDGETVELGAGSHALVRQGAPHTFWNSGDVPARCLIVLAPPDFAAYFREASKELAGAVTDDELVEARRRLSGRFEIEVVGPLHRA